MTTNCVCGLAQYLEIRTHAHPGACPSAVRVVKKGIRPCGQFQDKIYSGRRTCRSANQCPRLNASSGRQSRKDGQLDDLSQLGEYFKEELEQLQKGDLDELKTESQPSQASSRDAPELTGGYNTNSDDGDFEEGDEIFNLDSGWSVSAFDSDQSLESFSSSFGKIDADDEGAGMAACELLKTLPEHIVRRLEAEQREADAVEENRRQRRSGGGLDTKPKTQRRLRIIGGTAAGIRIHSQVGNLTRPMMEKVRGAIFDALISREGGSSLPAGARWLDLFAGTGSVGIEGLSRGCDRAHFIELDGWVVKNVLSPNLELVRVAGRAEVHQMRAEDFLGRARSVPRFAGGAFDYVSVCPPYRLVSYPELFSLLDGSPLLHDESYVVVEYPNELSEEIPDAIGSLPKFFDRKYGRTFVAMYGPA